jgi:hypothetical protein
MTKINVDHRKFRVLGIIIPLLLRVSMQTPRCWDTLRSDSYFPYETTIFVPSLEMVAAFKLGDGEIASGEVWFESYDWSGDLYVIPEYVYRSVKYQGKVYAGERIARVIENLRS